MSKRFNPFKWSASTQALWVSFFLPAIIMLSYFIYRHMAPFGSNSILTVDLGQQYVDFFASFRHAFFSDPRSIFFNFAKGLGGETYGDWAYYLMSPTNLLLLPFSNASLPIGILFLTVLKYGLAGWSMAFALKRMRWQRAWCWPLFAVTYSLMGWFVANELNLLWLDAAILLPLIVSGLEQYIAERSHWHFIWPLATIFIINYYMAYMIGIFLVLYIIWRLFWSNYSSHARLRMLRKFTFGSIVAIGLATVIWLPTAYTLINSKGQYMLENLKWHFEYHPGDILGKLFLGTFNFDQMPTGLPNIFVGSLVLIAVWLFFTSKQMRWQTRVVAGLITAFMVVSMMYAPLNLFWHAFQFPVWYPYRFSYLFSFWLIWLAASVWTPGMRISWWQLGSLLVVTVGTIVYLYSRLTHLNFLAQPQLIAGGSLFACMLVLHVISSRSKWWVGAVSLLVIGEMTASTIWTLNNFSFLTNHEYTTYINALQKVTNQLPSKRHNFYRVAQSFQRTKGDPLQGNYFGASTFSSALEQKQTHIMAVLGQPEGDNYISYDSGTVMTDSFLGMRYLMQFSGNEPTTKGTPTNMASFPRWDTNNYYHFTKQTNDIITSVNPSALPIAFSASQNALNVKFRANDPLTNQNRLWSSLLGYGQHDIFTAQNFSKTDVSNVELPATITGAFLKKQNTKQPASITLHYTPTDDNPYYLTLGGDVGSDQVSINVNGNAIAAIPSHRHTIILPLPSGQANVPQTITMTLNQDSVWLQNVSLYKSDLNVIKNGAYSLKQAGIQDLNFSSTKITGKINIPSGQNILMTTVPADKGWRMTIDGKHAEQLTVGKFFLAAAITPGEHKIAITFTPPYIKIGVIISIGTALFMIGLAWIEYFNRRRQKPLF